MKNISKRIKYLVGLSVPIITLLTPMAACSQTPDEIGKLNPSSIDLTAADFFKFFTSNDISERRSAELYLLGVLDSTEGEVWCDYRTFKIITLHERVFGEFKKLSDSQRKTRASTVIKEIFHRRSPCGEKK